MFDLINRGNLPRAVEDEFQHLISTIRGVFLKEHNEDGTHFVRPSGFDFVPIGAIMQWSTDTAPTGWVFCRGQALSRVDYASLFAVIGTTYGNGDGSTTFNVPDMQGRFPLGKASSGTASTLAGTGGSLDHTHTLGAHTHSIGSDGTHNHGASTGSAGAHDHGGSTGSEASHTHTFSGTTASAPGGNGVAAGGNNADPAFHSHVYNGTTDAGSSHNHTITSSADHTHSVSIDLDGSHDHGGVTGAASGGASGTANPPYLVVNHIILTGTE